MPIYRWFVRSLGAILILLTSVSAALAQRHDILHAQLGAYTAAPSVVAKQSGNWSDPAVWGGAVPAAAAKILIPSGITVTVDALIGQAYDWIRVDGLLRFQPSASTALTVHTLVVWDGARLEIGTPSQPVTGSAVLTLSSLGREFNHSADPFELTLGLIVMGQATIHGSPKTAFVPVSRAPQAGATRVLPDILPAGWRPGDKLVLTASTWGQEEDLTFQGIQNGEIAFAEPLRNARIFPSPGLAVHLGNLSRNVVIRSDPADAGNVRRQGHVMLMSEAGPHDIRYAEFRDTGRTTISPVTDPSIVPNLPADQIRAIYGVDLKPGTRDAMLCPYPLDKPLIPSENIRGRYGLHFHHVATFTAPTRHLVKGVAIHVKKNARLKFGFINHSSNVMVEDTVGYNIDGSTFMTEEGNEIGGFVRSLAVYSNGSNLANEDQPREILLQNSGDPYCMAIPNRRRTDMGHNGSGFWIHSGGLDVIENVAAGHTNAAYDHWTKPLGRFFAQPNLEFEVKYLRPGVTWLPGGDGMDIKCVPALYRNNIAYAAGFQRNGRKAAFAGEQALDCDDKVGGENRKTLLDGFIGWNLVQGVDTEYTSMTIWRNVWFVAGNRAPGATGMGLRRQATLSSNEIHNAVIHGFSTCYELGDNGVADNVRCLSASEPIPAPPQFSPAPPPEPPPPQPVDCVVSEWSAWVPTSDWSSCVNGSQSRTEQRTRTVLVQPENGGAACPALSETRTVTQSCTEPPPPPPPDGVSPEGTRVPPAAFIIDAELDKWTISSSGIPLENGESRWNRAVSQLAWCKGFVWAQKTDGTWHQRSGGWVFVGTDDPCAVVPPPPPPDTTGPTIQVSQSGVTTARYRIVLDAVDPSGIALIELVLDGQVLFSQGVTTSIDHTYELAPPRDHVLEIRVTDGAGNLSTQSLTVLR